jgi:hypothetical protein
VTAKRRQSPGTGLKLGALWDGAALDTRGHAKGAEASAPHAAARAKKARLSVVMKENSGCKNTARAHSALAVLDQHRQRTQRAANCRSPRLSQGATAYLKAHPKNRPLKHTHAGMQCRTHYTTTPLHHYTTPR